MPIHKTHLLLLSIITFVFISCGDKKKEQTIEDVEVVETKVVPKPKKIKVSLDAKNGTNASGSVSFKTLEGLVTVTAIVSGLAPGEHPVYIQKQETITTDREFIGNLIADENGNGTISKTSNSWCIGCEDKIKDILKKTVVIYSVADPTKVSCSGIIK
ncbi:hypothetical protein MHTCC0001_19420 [Flavobacteriaceae bacterium MHTCC 0001]